MRGGRVVQCAGPDELWRQPADDWVARFLGMRNIRDEGDRCLVIPPEAVTIEPGGGGVVVSAERRGSVVWLHVRLDEGDELFAVTTKAEHPQTGARVAVHVDPAATISVPRWTG